MAAEPRGAHQGGVKKARPCFSSSWSTRREFSARQNRRPRPGSSPWGQDPSPATPPTPREDTSSADPSRPAWGSPRPAACGVTTGDLASAPGEAPPLPPHAHTCTHTPEVPSTGLFGPADSLHRPSAHPRRHGHPVLGAFLPSGTCRTWPQNGTIPGSPLAQRKSALSLPSCLVTRVWRQ